jgi:inhibitor of KinA
MTTIGGIDRLTFYPLCEYALTVQLGNIIDEDILRQVSAFNKLLSAKPFPGLYQTVPAYTSLTVFYDPIIVARQPGYIGLSCFDKICNYLRELPADEYVSPETQGMEMITVPVCYDDDFGPDMATVATANRLSAAELISLHSQPVYTVFMMGFIPGFAYLGGLHALLHTPRKTIPRKAVPAGSVGIAGGQTGVYPLESPGGWQIIGRTPLKLFDAARPEPALLKAGALVKFEPISVMEFNSYHAE